MPLDQCGHFRCGYPCHKHAAEMEVLDDCCPCELQGIVDRLCPLEDHYKTIMVNMLPSDLISKSRLRYCLFRGLVPRQAIIAG